jgi:hypothetical protein
MDLPVPIDSFSGKPFPYHFDGKVVVIEALPPAGFSLWGGVRYELTVGGK